MSSGSLLLVLCVTLVSAHICMLNPPQRGGFNINDPGDMSCFQPRGPCGTVSPANPRVNFIGGSSASILVQQNLNHYNPGYPGFLQLAWAQGANPTESDFQVLATIPDYWAHNQAQQTNFSIPVQIPDINCPHCTLRIIYHPNKPTEPIFHNCADISITPQSFTPHPGKNGKGVLYALTSANVYDPYPYTLSSINLENGVLTPIQELGYVYKRDSAGTKMFVDDGMLAVSENNDVYFYGGTMNGDTQIPGTLFSYGKIFDIYANNMQPQNGTWAALMSHWQDSKRGLGLLKQIGNSNYQFSYEIYNFTPDKKLNGPLAATNYNDTFVNFFWAEYSTFNLKYYVFAGDENNPFILDAVLHTMDPVTGKVSTVSLDVSSYTFSSFSIDQKTGILYALSPGLFAQNKGWTLVKIDPTNGHVTPVKNVNVGTNFGHNYAGNVYNPIFDGYFMHIMDDVSTGGQVLVAFSLANGSIAYTTALDLGVNKQMVLRNAIMTSRDQ